MKQSFPLLLPLGILAFALIGCGGRPSNFSANAQVGTAASPTPAPASTPTSTPNPTSTAAPVPPPSGALSSALPTPPAGAVVLDQIQNTTDNWKTCALCAEGTNLTSVYWMAPFQTTPSMTGSSREFFIGGPKWSNTLFIKTYFDHFDATHFLWDFYVYWDPTTMANIWTAELDFWQVVNGKEFMIGSQCNFGQGYWDIWDQKANQWLHSTVRCQRMAPNTWHHIQWYLYRDNNTYHYDTLVVDGTAYNINRTFSPTPSNWPSQTGVQWQLDKSSTGVDLHEWVDNVKLTVW